MYKELVLECSEGRARIQIQEPATLSEIQEAEKVVGYKFPEELKALLLEMNPAVVPGIHPDTAQVQKPVSYFGLTFLPFPAPVHPVSF